MGAEVFVDQRPVVDAVDLIGKVTLSVGSSGNIVFANNQDSIRTRTGVRARLTLVGAAVDAGAEAYMTFHVKVNGSLISDPLYATFGPNTGTPALTYDPAARLIRPLDLPQGALVEVLAELASGAGASYAAYARIRVEYVDF